LGEDGEHAGCVGGDINSRPHCFAIALWMTWEIEGISILQRSAEVIYWVQSYMYNITSTHPLAYVLCTGYRMLATE
jgi:hypothetical protein